MIDQQSSGFKELQMQNRKSLGLGLQLGIGVTGTGNIGPYVGVGLNYTPKFLQW
jgi:outer membrane protein W